MNTLFYCLLAIGSCLLAMAAFFFNAPSLAIVFAALLAWFVSRQTIRENRNIFKDSETMSMMQNILWDTKYIEMRAIFTKARASGIDTFIDEPDSDEFKAIMKMMSEYELLAVGIKRGILSEKVLKDFIKPRLVRDWVQSDSFIKAMRDKYENPEIFCEFENLAKEWQ